MLNDGFLLIETLFSFLILAIIIILFSHAVFRLYKNYNTTTHKYLETIEQIETNLHELFLPIEDLEWAISQVIY